MTIRRMTSLLLATLMLMMCLAPFGQSAQAASSVDGMVRVHLASLSSTSSIDVTLEGSYAADGKASMSLSSGQRVNFAFDSSTGNITMQANGSSYQMGQEVRLRRKSSGAGMYIAQAKRPKCIYEGDLQLIARPTGSGFKLYPIMHVFIETYLHGVVPNEMSSSWPLEALRAQAVTARTYTLNRMNSQASALYDLGDTASHQVYYGYAKTVSRAVQAVNDTAGIVLMYNGGVCSTYYTASNGGQTESAKNIWGGSRYPYLTVKDDPYDERNPDANRRTRTVYKDFNHASQNSSLKSLLSNAVNGASIQTITAITPHTAKYPAPSRLYTKMDFRVQLSSGSSQTVTLDIFDTLESAMEMSITSSDNEIWTVKDEGSSFRLVAGRWGHGVGLSQRGAQQMANEGLNYSQILSFYFDGASQVKQNFTSSTLPSIGSGATPAPSAPPISGNEQLAIVNSNSATLNLRSGPSTDDAVIAEIPRGEMVVVTSYGATWCAIRWNGLTGYVMTNYLSFDVKTAAPATATPAPDDTKPGAPSDAPSGTAASLTSSTHLRASASESADSLLYIPQGETVSIITYGEEWCLVMYSGLTGYVQTSTLKQTPTAPTNPPETDVPDNPGGSGETLPPVWYPEEATPVPPTAPTAVPSLTPVNYNAVVVLATYLRESSESEAPQLASVPADTYVNVTMTTGTWSQITYNGLTGWVISSMLHQVDGPTAAPTATPTPTSVPTPTLPAPADEQLVPDITAADPVSAWIMTNQGDIPVYEADSTDAKVLGILPGGTAITVLHKGFAMSQVRADGLAGYVQNKYVTYSEPEEILGYRYINTETDPLALRDAPTTSGSAVLTRIPRGTKITLLKHLGDWCHVRYGDMTGYCATRYLSERKPEETPVDDNIVLDVTLKDATGWTGTVRGPEGSSIQMRKWCSTAAPEVVELQSGTQVTLLRKGNIWCHITYEGEEGYCLTSQLQLIGPPF